MCRPLLWSLMITTVGVLTPTSARAAEQEPRAVEEWQVKGILAALKDKYKAVHVFAAQELTNLLKSVTREKRPREWKGNSRGLVSEALPALRELFKDEDADVHRSGAEALVELYKDANDLPALRELLGDEDPGIHRSAAEALVELYERGKDLTALRDLLMEKGLGVRQHASAALARMGDKQAVPALRKLLEDTEPDLRRSAAKALAQLGENQAEPDLLIRLQDKAPNVRRSAAEALVELYERGKDLTALRDLLNYEDSSARWLAAAALARMGDKQALPALRKLLKSGEQKLMQDAAARLTRMGDKPAMPDLNDLLKVEEPKPKVWLDAAAALVELYERWKDLSALRELLKFQNNSVRLYASVALARMGDKQAVPALRELLEDTEPEVRRAAGKALVELYKGGKDVAALSELLREKKPLEYAALNRKNVFFNINVVVHNQKLKDRGDLDVFRYAAEALVELYERGKDLTALRDLLNYEDSSARWLAAAALARMGDKQALPALRKLLKSGEQKLMQDAAAALVRLYATATNVPALRDLLKSEDSSVRLYAAEALARMGEGTSVIALSIPYEDTSWLYWGRWLAYYWGGKNPDATKVLCDYLGRPAKDPDLPKSREDAPTVLRFLGEAWDKSDSRWLREDAAGWVARIITQQVKDWSAADVPELRKHLKRFEDEKTNERVQSYVPAIKEIIAPFEIWPPPWVRTLLAVAGVNLLAVLLFVVLRGHGGMARWLPFLAYAFAGVGFGLPDILKKAGQVHLNGWLLLGLLVGELLLLVAAGLVSPALLRQIARVEPLNRIAVPLAMYWPRSRRRFFRTYVDDLRQQVKYKKERANHEEYQTLPATVRSSEHPDLRESQDPAKEVFQQLAEGAGTEQARSVLVSAVGGRGKSALINNVVERALDQFEASPTHPLPVLLAGSEESRDVDRLVERALGPVLASPELLPTHLGAGDFILVFDGVTEGGPPAGALVRFARGVGRHAPLLLGARPSAVYEEVVHSRTKWMTVEPLPLDDNTLKQFIDRYNGPSLTESLKRACRGPNGGYVPLLVRIALTLDANQRDEVKSVADLYFGYLMQLFQSEFPDDSEKKLNRLGKTARWSVETYWKDGVRRRPYTGTEPQKALLGGGVLVGDRSTDPSEVWFVHDTLQTYLTAYGLWRLDREGYAKAPDVTTEGAWFRWTRTPASGGGPDVHPGSGGHCDFRRERTVSNVCGRVRGRYPPSFPPRRGETLGGGTLREHEEGRHLSSPPGRRSHRGSGHEKARGTPEGGCGVEL
jgi:HEAT repeat protein